MIKKYVINIFLLLSFSLMTIFFCEVIARMLFKPFPLKFIPSNDKHWIVDDEMRKYKLNPGSIGFFQSTEFNYKIYINDDGFRDISISTNYLKQPRNEKIFIIGDSFAFGTGVDYQNSIPGKVDYYINKIYNEDFSVINLGTPSYSLQQYLITLNHYLHLKPSHVIFIIFSGKLFGGADDIFGSTLFENWIKKSSEENLSQVEKKDYHKNNYKFENIKKYLLKNSGLYNLALLRIGAKLRAIKSSRSNLDKETFAKLKNGYRILDQTLEEIKKLAIDSNFTPIIVHIPPQSDIINEYTESRDRLQTVVRDIGFNFIDGMNILNTDENFYFPIDGHLNSIGYDHISRAIVTELIDSIRP